MALNIHHNYSFNAMKIYLCSKKCQKHFQRTYANEYLLYAYTCILIAQKLTPLAHVLYKFKNRNLKNKFFNQENNCVTFIKLLMMIKKKIVSFHQNPIFIG